MKDKGILLGDDGDLMVNPVWSSNGILLSGLTVDNSTYQNQYIILMAHPGELKEHPVLGVGISDITNDNDTAGWSSNIKRQLEKDGMKVQKVTFDRNLNLEIEAGY